MGYIVLVYFLEYRKVIYIILILVVFLPAAIFGSGQKEDRMPQVVSLMDERRYNDAILLLAEIMKTNPDQFAEAQILMQKITTARDSYNLLYDELITVLDPPEGEVIDEDKAYAIIREMESLDSNPNKAAVAAFAQAKKSIVFAVENRTYSIIMETAAAQIEAGEYTEAVDTYLGGYNLHNDGFVEKDYGNIVQDQVEIFQDTIIVAAKGFLNLYDTIISEGEKYSVTIAEGSLENIETGYNDYASVMIEAGEYWKTLKGTAAKLEKLRNSIQREDESDIPYISTNRILTVGRASFNGKEGIAGVIGLVWDNARNLVAETIMSQMENTYREAVNSYSSSSFDISRSLFAEAARLSSVAVNILKLRGEKLYLDGNLSFKDDGLETVTKELPELIYAKTISENVPAYRELSFLTEELNSLTKSVEAAGNIDAVTALLTDLKTLETNLNDSGINSTLAEAKKVYSSYRNFDLSKTDKAVSDLLADRDILSANLFNSEIRSEERILILKIDPERLVINDSSNEITEASAYIEGVTEEINGLMLTVRRPDRAVGLLDLAEGKLDKSEINLDSLLAETEGKEDKVKGMEPIIAQMEIIRQLKTTLTERKTNIELLRKEAGVLNDEADNTFSLARLRLDEAYVKFDREDYDGARKKYYEAESLFLKSLEYREDEDVRNLLTGELAQLDSDITTYLNRQIIREVRQLITKGKDYYNLQEFIKAEKSFQQAQDRYSVTNEEANTEIETWLVKIKRALEATSGREISITDPLYSDIIAILNRASEEFEKGKILLKTGTKDEADVHFNEAIKNIELVKTPFPRNFKASVMYLEILEYTQKDAFERFFQTMFDTAVKNMADDPKTSDDNLLALYEINPDYPGIKNAIYRSGVAAGRIIPPPAQVDIKRATSLYNQALAIVNADQRSQFPIALAYLEEAIQINNDYDAAAILMDRIRTSTGAVSQVAMSVTDTQQLRYAESLYIDGRYLEANIIINQLWANPENRKSAKLNDLKVKVEARL